jgi:uncharacterized protein (TIGR02145 family)
LRSQAGDAKLKSLEVSVGTLSPAFSPTIYDYTVNLAEGVSSITATGIPSHSGASVTGNATLTRCSGGNIITLTVTSEDATMQKIYRITVTGAVSDGIYTYRTKCYGGVEWMIDNAKKPRTTDDGCTGNSIDGSYGHYYSHSCAEAACPTGWMLPGVADVTALTTALNAEGASAWADWNSGNSLAGAYNGASYMGSGAGYWWRSETDKILTMPSSGYVQFYEYIWGNSYKSSVRCRKN